VIVLAVAVTLAPETVCDPSVTDCTPEPPIPLRLVPFTVKTFPLTEALVSTGSSVCAETEKASVKSKRAAGAVRPHWLIEFFRRLAVETTSPFT
jgi:hypothetical protein